MKLTNQHKLGLLVFFLAFVLFIVFVDHKIEYLAGKAQASEVFNGVNDDAIKKARVVDGLMMAAEAKRKVAETTIVNNALPLNQAVTGYESPAATEFVQSIAIQLNGVIVVTYTAAAGDGTIILTPTLTPEGAVTWNCTGGTLSKKYRPASCL